MNTHNLSPQWLRLLPVLRRWFDSVVVDLLFYIPSMVCGGSVGLCFGEHYFVSFLD